MTPKEKAKELIDKMNKVSTYIDKEDAKLCAAVAVEEIQSTGTLQNRTCGYEPIEIKHIEYWQQVKTEIENYD